MAVITISRNLASGGRELGQLLSKRLGYQYVDKSLFQKIAEDLNVSETTLESFEKSREHKISYIFSNLFSKGYIQRIVGYDKSVVEEQEYQTSLKNLISGVAHEDNVVIIGRASYCILKDKENCYRFRLIASMDWRKKYAVEKLGMPLDRVQEIIEKSDRNQRWFRRSICGAGYDDPNFFHLTLNMGTIPIEKAVKVLMSIAHLK